MQISHPQTTRSPLAGAVKPRLHLPKGCQWGCGQWKAKKKIIFLFFLVCVCVCVCDGLVPFGLWQRRGVGPSDRPLVQNWADPRPVPRNKERHWHRGPAPTHSLKTCIVSSTFEFRIKFYDFKVNSFRNLNKSIEIIQINSFNLKVKEVQCRAASELILWFESSFI